MAPDAPSICTGFSGWMNELNCRALGDADAQVHERESPPAELAFDDDAEGPQKHHVADQVHETAVHEQVREPLEGMHAVADLEHPFFVVPGREHEKRHHAQHDHRDRGISADGKAGRQIPRVSASDHQLRERLTRISNHA